MKVSVSQANDGDVRAGKLRQRRVSCSSLSGSGRNWTMMSSSEGGRRRRTLHDEGDGNDKTPCTLRQRRAEAERRGETRTESPGGDGRERSFSSSRCVEEELGNLERIAVAW